MEKKAERFAGLILGVILGWICYRWIVGSGYVSAMIPVPDPPDGATTATMARLVGRSFALDAVELLVAGLAWMAIFWSLSAAGIFSRIGQYLGPLFDGSGSEPGSNIDIRSGTDPSTEDPSADIELLFAAQRLALEAGDKELADLISDRLLVKDREVADAG